jgi:hypothetical protein
MQGGGWGPHPHCVVFIRKGFLRGILDNLHDTLDKQYYFQLKHHLRVYCNVTPFQILEHLNDHWCPLDIKVKKVLKVAYFTKWDGDEHLTAFRKRLNNNQRMLVRSNITSAGKDNSNFTWRKCTTATI